MKKTFMGLKLRRLRAERGLSQTALAHTLGISPSYLNQIEQNQRPLTVSVLLKISQTLGVDVPTLLARVGTLSGYIVIR